MGLTILSLEGEKEKLKKCDKLTLEVGKMDNWWSINRVYNVSFGKLLFLEVFMRLECRNSISWNCKNLFGLQDALRAKSDKMKGNDFITRRVRDIGFFTILLTKVVDLPYRTGLITSVIEKFPENKNDQKVKFGLVKSNVYLGNKWRVGAYCVLIKCDEKDSAHMQRVFIRAQRGKGF